eukprot:Seg2835.3 transcript_id=Seg2835.3/GoldUCD/mRNA.D3Y31 product="hypothetical protein" protein_id=Seg2835.3/GoldUCD/D3Y31
MPSRRRRPANRRELDESISLEDWSGMGKRTLQTKAAEYGLRISGNKKTLSARIYSYLHSTPAAVSSPEAPSTAGESEESEPEVLPERRVFRTATAVSQ